MKNTFLTLLLTLFATAALATHNRAGYIFYRQTDNLTIEATIVTWTKTSSVPADRDTLTLCWGDGICERVARANGPGSPPQGVALGFDYKENFYTATHTYSQTGVYTIFMTDPNRNGGVLNVNFPNSDQIKFHIETTVTLLNVGGGMENRSPRVLARPILLGHLGQPFVYAPEAYDPDADSLSFELTVPLQDSGAVVPNYVELTGIDPGPDNQLSFDPYSGKLVWDSPQQVGQYNFAILIRSFRDGVEIGVTILDLEIVIGNFGNTIPTLSISPAYTESHIHCLSVGDTLELSFTAQDEAPGEEATLEFFSGFNKKLEYTIRFQNTGNDTAFTVVLRDTLDANLDWNTFAPFSSSHPYEFVLDQRTGVLIFTFRDINLPDSTTNEVASQGFVSYTNSAGSAGRGKTIKIWFCPAPALPSWFLYFPSLSQTATLPLPW